ncbi:RNA polymerase sigma factor, sigma-70 family [Desulfosporosinus youngiae DSM 17734]|uniref:RNA polymerase sigma factor, sigma-70 family n=2 Tax=Desulfosporosinus TaxID=79206 RepID=H5XUM8_9FIRM|nr:RNA polymerase sigma factor, sigma-70 family [Desulfosporosinus youngiae DSM 17734]
MKKENILASYLINLGEEVFRLLLAKGAKKEDAEDIIQNTFYKVYTLLDDLTENNIRPWFFRVALNEYIDLKRKKEQQNIYLTEEIYSKLQQSDHEFEAILNKDEIFCLLKDIKKEYKEIFFLKYYYDFSHEEIASILEIKVNSVKQKLYRARLFIHSKIGGNVNGDFVKRFFAKS